MQALEQNPSVTMNATKPKFLTDKCCGIYGLRNRLNGKWYIGQSVDIGDRWKNYFYLNCRRQKKLYSALKKYGWENFDKILLEQTADVDWILDYREMFWIKHFDSFVNGYNATIGGQLGTTFIFKHKKHRPETIEKIRLSKLGKKRGPYRIKPRIGNEPKRAAWNKGKTLSARSPGTKNKIRIALLGMKHPAVSIANRTRNKKSPIVEIEDNG